MMASAMMADTTGGVGTVADLAPTMTMGLKDDMWRLEAKGHESDVKKREKNFFYCSKSIFNPCYSNWVEHHVRARRRAEQGGAGDAVR